MKTKIIEHIDCIVTKEDVLKKLGMPTDHAFGSAIQEVIEEAKGIVNAKLICGEAKIEARTEDTVTIEGVIFHGRDLVEALREVEVVYPYICTCGKEIDDYAWGCKDLVKMLYLDNIMHFYLRQTAIEVSRLVDNHIGGQSIGMTPGSFEEWPLSEQAPMFQLLNGEALGVTLTDHFIMYPAKSLSGFRFKAGKALHNCSLCLREPCDRREKDFDEDAYDATLC